MNNNTSAPMGVSDHICSLARGMTAEAAAWQRTRYGGLLCQPSKTGYVCTGCGTKPPDVEPLRGSK
jgi:hypothetical protein